MALTDDLEAYWRLDEASGDRVDQIVDNDLSDINTVTSEAGRIGDGASFDRDNTEYLDGPATGVLAPDDSTFTIAAWVKLATKANTQDIVTKWESVAGGRSFIITFDQSADRFAFLASHDGSSSSRVDADNLGSPAVDTWYLVIAWFNFFAAANDELWIQVNNGTVNGVFADSQGMHPATGSNFRIGALTPPGTRTMDGVIDEVGFWSRELTADERTELYNAGSGNDPTAAPVGPVGVKRLKAAPAAAMSAHFVPIHQHLQINRPDGDSGAHAYTILYREEDA